MARKYQPGDRSGHTILVIDDSPEILESARQLLEREGHTVFVAADGESGIAIESHSMTHRYLSELEPELIRWELAESRTSLEQLLQKPVKFLAIPSGAYNSTVTRLVTQAEAAGVPVDLPDAPRRYHRYSCCDTQNHIALIYHQGTMTGIVHADQINGKVVFQNSDVLSGL